MSYRFAQKVLFKHCDPAGIVFYPRYFEMINDVVEAWFCDRLDAPFEGMHPDGGVPTAQIQATFTAPSRHGDHLVITLECTRIGGASADLAFTATCGEQTRFTASSTLVNVNANGRPERWPDRLRAAINREIGEN
ncbi:MULTISPECIES: thioesterase family protein [unclassified Roseitalea]|uniref:acyl-CoA thioesterase n=1 Tax=unclassified Roseitalea TaxID=2639107 RepID=UPI00273D4784|nr:MULTISPECIES: thioesterase family protein [unclassified Roseitalea]